MQDEGRRGTELAESEEVLAVAERFFTAMSDQDLETVKQIYSDDVMVWHNTDMTEKRYGDAVAPIAWAFNALENIQYRDVKRIAIEGGFVQQHIFTAVQRHDGRQVVQPAVVICRVAGGKITRLEEYFDSQQAPTGLSVTSLAT